jgi:hypothetical protein
MLIYASQCSISNFLCIQKNKVGKKYEKMRIRIQCISFSLCINFYFGWNACTSFIVHCCIAHTCTINALGVERKICELNFDKSILSLSHTNTCMMLRIQLTCFTLIKFSTFLDVALNKFYPMFMSLKCISRMFNVIPFHSIVNPC